MPVTKNCKQCGTLYSRPPSQVGDYCCKRCAYEARKKEKLKTRRMVYLPKHPLAMKGGLVPEYRAILYEKIGVGPHPCHWCGTAIDWNPGSRTKKGSLVVDHVNNDKHNNSVENLVPACQGCNSNRSRKDLIADDELYTQNRKWRLRAEKRTCHTCGTEFLFSPSRARPTAKNTGRYCSKRCMWDRPR